MRDTCRLVGPLTVAPALLWEVFLPPPALSLVVYLLEASVPPLLTFLLPPVIWTVCRLVTGRKMVRGFPQVSVLTWGKWAGFVTVLRETAGVAAVMF